ncbi:L,D-transpeptidase [Actinacidiphila guanduensis]|uniref:Lipoprotein-anchoring transpeptidase ErfK/SrfK n=1 Tax=Actinacidiphila guanduensis TaxID=310781 RepID=A0A1H0HMN2_9ACTN|nr:L,D-transpeptidase [Actinacidiphila guanduensis]SDO20458.1 Lipoprotein-anchoring transpeptidase ErfK/SrfK [Actinacidiphila guanduensis]
MGRVRTSMGIALVAGAVLAGTSACGGSSAASSSAADAKEKPAPAASTASPKPTKPKPLGPPMLLDTITPATGTTVGVAMPISVVFSNPVAPSARAGIEKAMRISTSVPVTGAWHWFSDTRVDFRPETYWKPGTRVTVDADMTNVPNGNGRYGVHSYHHTFTIGSDDEAQVSVKDHTMKVTHNGTVVKTFPIDAGSPTWPSWDGTMAVIDKSKEVRMTSCSVGISCNKSSPDYYDLTLPWDVHLTTSGTYVHYSTGDPYPGHSYGSHGCVHLSMANAKWFYDFVRQGDPITITGSPRGKAAGDNGYADYNLDWSTWLKSSGEGQITTQTA